MHAELSSGFRFGLASFYFQLTTSYKLIIAFKQVGGSHRLTASRVNLQLCLSRKNIMTLVFGTVTRKFGFNPEKIPNG